MPPVSENLDRAAAWTWRLLVCAAALAVLLALLWYVRVIVLPIAVALTIAPALSPVASWFRRRRHLERAAAGLALLTGLAVVAVLVSIVAVSVVEQFDELVDSVARAVDDIVAQLESEPFNLTLARRLPVDARGLVAAGVRLCRLGRAGRCRHRHRRRARRRDALLRAAGRRRSLGVDPAALPVRRAPGGRSCGPARVGRPRRVRSRNGAGRDDRRGADRDRALAARRAACVRTGGARVHGLVRAVRRRVRLRPRRGARRLRGRRLGARARGPRPGRRASSSSRGRSSSRRSRAAASTCTRRSCCSPSTAGGSLFGIAGAFLAVPVTAVVAAVHASLAAEEPVSRTAPS